MNIRSFKVAQTLAQKVAQNVALKSSSKW